MVRTSKSAASLVVGEDRLEARSMPVKEQFTSLGVVKLASSNDVSKQRQWMTIKHTQSRLEPLPANVNTNPPTTGSSTVVLVVATDAGSHRRRALVLTTAVSYTHLTLPTNREV